MFYTKNRALFTDLYELTMSQGYFELNIDKEATFELFFRSNPFNGGYAIASGIYLALEFLENFKFTEDEIAYLKSQKMFTENFLDYLYDLKFNGHVEGVLEGTIVFPNVPLMRVTGSIIEAQIVESTLLNIINYSTLIATKARRIIDGARGGKVIDFGLRRAQGDSIYIGVRAALIGGCIGTSFVQAGKIWNCPIIGTQAHSWVQTFDSEYEAFKAYADVYPEKCLLLIDTYNTVQSGIPNAIKIAEYLRKKGKELVGVRIDSGDLAYLSVEAYQAFSKAGFPNIMIVLSNELDEYTISSIVNQIKERGNSNNHEKKICEETIQHLIYGVGTKLITGGNQSALDGVYKLVALDGEPRIKVSENVNKIINPGMKSVWRVSDEDGKYFADVITLQNETPPGEGDWIFHPTDHLKNTQLPDTIKSELLHMKLMEKGKIASNFDPTDWKTIQNFVDVQFQYLDPTYRRLLNPHIYKVSLTEKLYKLKMNLIQKYRTKL